MRDAMSSVGLKPMRVISEKCAVYLRNAAVASSSMFHTRPTVTRE
jgi:hypothetical protein